MAVINQRKTGSTVRSMVQEHYREIANSAARLRDVPRVPAEGWVRTIRKALDMSGAQLAAKLGLSRNRVSVLERREAEGDITLNQLKELAAKLDCEFTYALVPKKDITRIMRDRAETLAKSRLEANTQNMFLEAQSIDPGKQEFLTEQLTEELLRAGGRVLWKNDQRTTKK